jgi:hypothetical protein
MRKAIFHRSEKQAENAIWPVSRVAAMLETHRSQWRDFTAIPTLCRRAGCAADDLVLAAGKELFDNALDASPRGIEAEIDADARTISARDFGPGLSEEKACELFSVSRDSVSSKRWRQARRGALGNGARVIMGVAVVSGGHLSVESRGEGYRLEIGPDGAVRVADRFVSAIEDGSRIVLTVGAVLTFDAERVRDYVESAMNGVGLAFGGTKAVPAWFDRETVLALIRDVAPTTSVLTFARQFDLGLVVLDAIKRYIPRGMTTLALQDQPSMLASFIATILDGGQERRALKRMGRDACGGTYAHAEGTFKLGAVDLPFLTEAWAWGVAVESRKDQGWLAVDTIYANRTPMLGLSASQGLIYRSDFQKAFVAAAAIQGYKLDWKTALKGPCSFIVDLAITTPELPLISEGKAVDLRPFLAQIRTVIETTICRAYKPPEKTLAEVTPPKPAREPKPEKPVKEPKPEPPPRPRGPLALKIEALCEANGRTVAENIVMSDSADPYALDTAANHRLAEWFAEAQQTVGIFGQPIHNRGCHYAFLGQIRKPDGTAYENTPQDWRMLERASNLARWLRYVAWGDIIDERNAPPLIRWAHDMEGTGLPRVVSSAPFLMLDQGEGSVRLEHGSDDSFPRRRQPYRLILFGEKTSLEPTLGAIAEEFNASLFLPTGEISNSMLASMAVQGVADGRRSIIFTFSDFDPVGNNMPVNIARKLQAFRDLHFPNFEFEVHPVALTADQVAAYNLPSTPLKKTETRARAWRQRYPGFEQTEIDALATLRRDVLERIARAAIEPFHDKTLDQRQNAAIADWTRIAEERMQAATDLTPLESVRKRMLEFLQQVEPEIAEINAQGEAAMPEVEIDYPPFDAPGPVAPDDRRPEALVSSDMDPTEFVDRLRERRIVVGDK